MKVVFWLCLVFASTVAFADPTKDLFDAIRAGDLEKFKAALAEGADPNAQDANGNFPLHVVATMGDIRLIEPLVERGADVDRRNRQGQTPIHIAAQYGHRNELEAFVRFGGDLDLRDGAGFTARQLAQANHHDDIEEMYMAPATMLILIAEGDQRRRQIAALQRFQQERDDRQFARILHERENGPLSPRQGDQGLLRPGFIIPAAAALVFGLFIANGPNNGSQ